jgi:hypothetical protein
MSTRVPSIRRPKLEMFPDMTSREQTRRRLANALLERWDECLDAYLIAEALRDRIEKLQAKLDAPEHAHIPAADPRRAKAEERIYGLRQELRHAVEDWPTASSAGGLRYQLETFAGLLRCDEPSLIALHVNAFGGRSGDEDLGLLDMVYRNPELVAGQEFWPEILEVYEQTTGIVPDRYWAMQRAFDALDGHAVAGWRGEWRAARGANAIPADVPF